MLEFRTLGAVELRAGDGRDLRSVLHQPKRIALLAYLAVAGRSGFLRRDKVLALFWPQLDTDHARGSLRSTLHRLRGTLGDDVIVRRGADELRANDVALSCDVNRLRDAADAGDFKLALDEYRGEFLDGLYVNDCASEFGEWVESTRRRLRDISIDSAWKLAEQCKAAGKIMEAITFARRALDIAPLDEDAIRHLLSLQIEAGNHAAAVTMYEEYARRLTLDFQVEPSPETSELVARLRNRSTPAGSRPVEASFPVGTPAAPPPPRESSYSAPLQPEDEGIAPPATRANDSATDAAPAGRWRYALVVPAFLLLYAGIAYIHAQSELTSAARRAAPMWEKLSVDGAAPLARSHAIAILDSTDRSILLFGGRAGEINVGDLWRVTGFDSGDRARWTRVRTAGDAANEPRGRFLAAAAYSRRTDRLILFGGAFGYTTPCTEELWILTNASGAGGTPRWEKVAHPAGAPWPAPRAEHAVAYDEASNRLMLYGGHDCVAPVFTDYWVLRDADGSTGTPAWERIIPDTTAGTPREPRGQAMAFSPGKNRLIVFGGFDYRTLESFNDSWILTDANGLGARPAWRRLKIVGTLPPGRIQPAFGFDPSTDRLVIALGDNGKLLGDGWVLVGADGSPPESRWIPLPLGAPAPSPRGGSAAVFDPLTDRLIIFGGASPRGSPGDMWVLRNATGR